MKSKLVILLALLALMTACGSKAIPAGPIVPLDVTFTTEDEVDLAGRWFARDGLNVEDAPVVVLAHMYPADQRSWQGFAETLAQQGYLALTFDFRGYGSSKGDKEISKIDRDMEAALDFLEGHGAKKVFLVGASMGGAVSLMVASQRNVAGVVTLSAPLDFRGLSALDAIYNVQAPKLLLASEGDTAAAQSADELFKRAPGVKEKRIVKGTAHGTEMLNGNSGTAVQDMVLSFLARQR